MASELTCSIKAGEIRLIVENRKPATSPAQICQLQIVHSASRLTYGDELEVSADARRETVGAHNQRDTGADEIRNPAGPAVRVVKRSAELGRGLSHGLQGIDDFARSVLNLFQNFGMVPGGGS